MAKKKAKRKNYFTIHKNKQPKQPNYYITIEVLNKRYSEVIDMFAYFYSNPSKYTGNPNKDMKMYKEHLKSLK